MDSSKLTLRDIADRAVARNGGKGGRALGRVAEQRGLTLSYTTVDKIRAGTYMSTPSAKTLEALSVLSGEPLSVVYDAAGLPMPRGSFADNLPPDADLLEPEQRKIVYDVVRALARQNKELYRLRELQKAGGEHDQRSAPRTQAGDQPAQDQTREAPLARPAWQPSAEDESKVHTLNPPDQGDPAPPADIAARDVGAPSRGQQLRDNQDRDAELPE